MGAAADEVVDEVSEDGEVDDEERNPQPGDAIAELEYLEREEGGGDEGGEVLGPDFFKHEADAFEDSERCVAEEEEADLAEAVIVDKLCFLKDDADQTAFGVHSQAEGKVGEELGDVVADEAKSAYADADEQRRLEQLVDGDQLQPAIALLPSSSRGHLQIAPESRVSVGFQLSGTESSTE